MGKFVIKDAKNGVKFDLKASNGEVILTSEVYSSLRSCKNGIASVTKNAPVAALEDPIYALYSSIVLSATASLSWNVRLRPALYGD